MLTGISIAHMNKQEHYVADQCFPLVGVNKQSDIYAKYTRGDFFQGAENTIAIEGGKRAPGTRAAQAGYTLDTSNTYFAENYAVGVMIPDEVRGNADAPFQLDKEATMLATQIQLIRRERTWATDFMKTTVWGTDKSVGTKWSDYGGSDPFTDLEDGLDKVESETGERPNKLIMGAITWRRLKHHPDLIDRINGGATNSSPAMATKNLLAQVLEIDSVLVGRASYRSSVEGASLAMTRILDDDALLLNVNPNPGLMTPTAGITFFWKPLTGGGIQFMRKYREEPERKDTVENHSYYDQVATESESGYFFSDVVD